jgi:hypothetical protein
MQTEEEESHLSFRGKRDSPKLFTTKDNKKTGAGNVGGYGANQKRVSK